MLFYHWRPCWLSIYDPHLICLCCSSDTWLPFTIRLILIVWKIIRKLICSQIILSKNSSEGKVGMDPVMEISIEGSNFIWSSHKECLWHFPHGKIAMYIDDFLLTWVFPVLFFFVLLREYFQCLIPLFPEPCLNFTISFTSWFEDLMWHISMAWFHSSTPNFFFHEYWNKKLLRSNFLVNILKWYTFLSQWS